MELDLATAWRTVERFLSPGAATVEHSEDQLRSVVRILHEAGLSAEILTEWLTETFSQYLYNEVAPNFWKCFSAPVDSMSVIQHVCTTFQQLYDHLTAYHPCFDCLAQLHALSSMECGGDIHSFSRQGTHNNAQLLVKAIVFPSVTPAFQSALVHFYTKAFKASEASASKGANAGDDSNISGISGITDADESGEEAGLMTCRGCEQNRDTCVCLQTVDAFHQVNGQLRELGLLEGLSGEAVSSIIHKHIKHHIEHTCKGNFEQAYLESLEQWLENKVVGWLEVLYGCGSSDGITSPHPDCDEVHRTQNNPISAHRGRLYHYMYTTYAETRITELFNIIIEFPESGPALQDLKTCLEKTDLRGKLVSALRNALETRLLHPGVNTADILTAYISGIRALRVLDPTGVLLELVCEPVRTYLRCREDTVRCIVSSLTEDSASELSDELVKGQPLMLNESGHSEHDLDSWEMWTPDPVDADPVKMSVNRRSSDIISMLVNIYGSKELFVNEYRTLLADRILTQFNYDTEKEIRYLELLKLRFGESQLHYCEVMLKDVADSKRINTHITDQREKKKKALLESAEKNENTDETDKENEEEQLAVNAMILSAEFWPTFREEKLELPEMMQKALDRYTKAFEAYKGNRTLNWKTHLGLVNVEIELKDRKLELNVSPVHATILWHFQHKAEWTVDELSAVMHMPAVTLRRRMAFWQSQGLLREESSDKYLLVEEQRGGQRGHEVVIVEEDETESAMASASDQREEEMQVVWSYIVGMLTNLESLPLDRIHVMLKMFAMQGPMSDCSEGELKAFLDRKVKEQKLIYATGVYRLPKPGS